MVDERANVDERSVSVDRVFEVPAVQGRFEGIEETPHPAPLRLCQIGPDRIVVDQFLASAGAERHVATVELVLLDDVPARDLGLGVIVRIENRDIHAIRSDLDLLHEDVDADVIVHRQLAVVGLEEQLDEPRARRIAAHLVAPAIDQDIAHQRLVRVGSLEHPVRVGGQPQDRGGPVAIVVVPDLEVVLLLGETLGTLAPHVQTRPAGKIGLARHGGCTPFVRIDNVSVDRGLRTADGFAHRIDNHQRKR